MRKIPNGFTLIEILVALFVFGVGILSVLGMITQNISTVQFVKTQTQATFLAKEGLEVVFNVRDTNFIKSLPWNCAREDLENTNNQNTFCNAYFFVPGQSSVFLVQFSLTGGYALQPLSLASGWRDRFDQTRLYLHNGKVGGDDQKWTGSRYNHDITGGVISSFARFIQFTGVSMSGVMQPYDQIVKVNSRVLYQVGGKTGEVVLESFIGKIQK